MSRRLLVIGSQCEKLNPLSFLPGTAERIHALMIHPGPGECVGADVGQPKGLLLNPTADQARMAMKGAIAAAAQANETLILAYLGHGEFVHGDFYLMPIGAPSPPDSQDAIHLSQFIKETTNHPRNGLVVLIDACHSGEGAQQAARTWVGSLGVQHRFEFLSANGVGSTDKARLIETLIRLLKRGDPDGSKTIRCEDARRWVMRLHPHLDPQHPTHNADASLHLGRNPAKDPGDVFWNKRPGSRSNPRTDLSLPADPPIEGRGRGLAGSRGRGRDRRGRRGEIDPGGGPGPSRNHGRRRAAGLRPGRRDPQRWDKPARPCRRPGASA